MRIVIKFARRRGGDGPHPLSLLWVWLISVCLAGNAAAQVKAGTIKDLSGAAEIQRHGRSIAAAPGMSVQAGDKLETRSKSYVTIELIDGSQLMLSDASSLVIVRTMTSAADSMI
jgi:hypothetical protein